jgi:hypothetical protein
MKIYITRDLEGCVDSAYSKANHARWDRMDYLEKVGGGPIDADILSFLAKNLVTEREVLQDYI